MLKTIFDTLQRIEAGINHACTVTAQPCTMGLQLQVTFRDTRDREHLYEVKQTFTVPTMGDMTPQTNDQCIQRFVDLANREIRQVYAAPKP